VQAAVEAEGRTFDKEVHDLYVSPVIAKALHGERLVHARHLKLTNRAHAIKQNTRSDWNRLGSVNLKDPFRGRGRSVVGW
jgi:hypothetical protein